jgi:hypothetical protein
MHYLDLNFYGNLLEEVSSLPKFLGPTLRGAFGHVFKGIVCQMAHGDCNRCILRSRCPYPLVFDGIVGDHKHSLPQPFVLIVPDRSKADGSRINWTIRLLGIATRYWPSVLHAFVEICERGIGRDRIKIGLDTVTNQVGECLWSTDGIHLHDALTSQISTRYGTASEPVTLKWRFSSPVCGIDDSETGRITGMSLLLHGRRRWNLLNQYYGDGTNNTPQRSRRFEESEFEIVEHRLRHWTCNRYSSRTRSRMELWGVRGHITIRGPWFETGEWLDAVPYIHLGKSTSFGCGRVTWEIVSTPRTVSETIPLDVNL